MVKKLDRMVWRALQNVTLESLHDWIVRFMIAAWSVCHLYKTLFPR